MYRDLVSESKNINNEKIRDLVETYLPKRDRKAFYFDGKKAATTKTLIQIMNQKDITIVEKDCSTRDEIKKQFPKVNILDGYLSENISNVTDKNIFYFDFMVNFRGSYLNNEYPLRDIYKVLLQSTKDTIVLGVTFSLRSAKKAYDEPSWKTISDELFAIFNTCDYSIKYSEKPLSYRRKSKRKFGNPMCFCVYVLHKLDKIQFTVTRDKKGKEYVDMLGMTMDELV